MAWSKLHSIFNACALKIPTGAFLWCISMSGPAESKIELKDAKVYIHLPDKATRSKILHIDIEHPMINEIIKPKEATYAAGKYGGVFIGLKKEMIERASKVLKKKMD